MRLGSAGSGEILSLLRLQADGHRSGMVCKGEKKNGK